ncbi:MAG: metallophosphoesterase family protein [Candidatus Micrarchaeia archaeon]
MRIAVISDVHANLPALIAVLRKIDALAPELTLCAGDVVGYNPFPNETVEEIRKRQIACVMGNHDWACLSGDTGWFNPSAAAALAWTRERLTGENMAWIARLPKRIEKNVGGLRVLMVHGSPDDELFEYVFREDAERRAHAWLKETDVLVLGHTHVPMGLKVEIDGEEKMIVNPGAVGQPRDGDPRASLAVLDTEELGCEWVRLAYDARSVRDAIYAHELPRELGDRLLAGF